MPPTSNLITTLIVDFVSVVRHMPISKMNVFADLFEYTWRKVRTICEHQKIEVVFDSHVEKSVKEGEKTQSNHKNMQVSRMTLEFLLYNQID